MADENAFKNLVDDLERLAGSDTDKAFSLFVENFKKLSNTLGDTSEEFAKFKEGVQGLLGSLSEEQKKTLESIKTFEGYSAAIKQIVEAKKQLEAQAEKVKKAQEKLSKAFEEGTTAAEGYLGMIGFGSSPGLQRAMASLKDKMKLVEEGTASLGQVFKASALSLAGLSLIHISEPTRPY